MIQLCLFRHAKSSWDDPRLADEERPLTPKGIARAIKVSKYLAGQGFHPDLLVSSPAVRAYYTAMLAARELGYPAERIVIAREIYEGPADRVLDLIYGTDNKVASLMIFGHNPTITDLANLFLRPGIPDMQTSAAVGINFEASGWEEIMRVPAIKAFHVYPAKLKKR